MNIRLVNLLMDFVADDEHDKIIDDNRIKQYDNLFFSTSNYKNELLNDYHGIDILAGEDIIAEIFNDKYDIYNVEANISFIEIISGYIDVELFYNDFNQWIKKIEETFLSFYD